ncbi:TIGR03089 family protein [Rugosimonospora africana]|uniref:TIGR03089 family protein n=1 Tax=Rugosimonospora africana TaxID=556532 RepID=A0A8J3VPP4_9ACTN|nr:TIGR03089 family protein [Rugosimonospora africana]GIH14172.1 hypothetical protein Raf01_23440 [Rugosimonospora africana]
MNATADVKATADVPALLGGDRTESGRPLLTYYDDATGERVELTAEALGSWAARTANLMREGCGMGIGSRAAMLLPPHWQTAAVLLGAWSTGVAVSFRLAALAGLPSSGPDADAPLDATFVSWKRLDDWLEDVPPADHRFVLGLAAAGAPMREVPDGYRDYIAEVRRYSDLPPSYLPERAEPATVDGTTFGSWEILAREVAGVQELRPGDRLLIDAAEHDHPLKWLLAPLSAGASVVLCANLDRDRMNSRIEAEGITRVL